MLAQAFAFLIPKKYRGIADQQVARALLALANQDLEGTHVIESDQLRQY